MPAPTTQAAIWLTLRNDRVKGRPLPDIDPADELFIMAALEAAFPGTTVQCQPRPAQIATLFRVFDGGVLRRQLLAPRWVLDDARENRMLATLVTRAATAMRQHGPEMVILGDVEP
jgi:hypothetical protein